MSCFKVEGGRPAVGSGGTGGERAVGWRVAQNLDFPYVYGSPQKRTLHRVIKLYNESPDADLHDLMRCELPPSISQDAKTYAKFEAYVRSHCCGTISL